MNYFINKPNSWTNQGLILQYTVISIKNSFPSQLYKNLYPVGTIFRVARKEETLPFLRSHNIENGTTVLRKDAPI